MTTPSSDLAYNKLSGDYDCAAWTTNIFEDFQRANDPHTILIVI